MSFRTNNSSLEGATEFKFAPSCSSFGTLSDGLQLVKHLPVSCEVVLYATICFYSACNVKKRNEL